MEGELRWVPRVLDSGIPSMRPDFDGPPIFAWTVDTEFCVRPAFSGLSELDSEATRALPAEAEPAHRRALAGESSSFEAQVGERHFRVFVEPLRDGGAVVGALAVAIDPVKRRSLERPTLEGQLRRALEKNEFVLHYQPIVDVGGTIVGVEALVRWQHPEHGMVLPETFIGMCEKTGFIVPLGHWVMRTALAQVRDWAAQGVDTGRIALNISARQLYDPDLVPVVGDALVETRLLPKRLELEITESAVLQDLAGAQRAIRQLKALGVRVALDDFGTGYSALSHLKHFSVDALKIDRTFVRDLPGERGDVAIVSAIVALGHALGLRVTAEGVETAAQAVLVRKLGCDELQGFYYARPIGPAEIEDFVLVHGRRVRVATG